ncbi:Zwei Ig domain protein zig-8 [Gonioctena quinquepunctata]|nr:Zwei Ig domain protein zig-8 [Gonioctena quinquepunctata]
MVSWVRHRDIHLLTVGRYTYTSDQRFEAVHTPHTEEWTLRIRYPQKKDSGIYECQISTTPPIGHFLFLTIVGCHHYNQREVCKFFKFPKDPQLKKKCILLVRRDIEPGPGAFLCSCHFIDGKRENGPQLFEHNRKKRFNFSTPEKRKRSATNQKDGISTASATARDLVRTYDQPQPSTSSQYLTFSVPAPEQLELQPSTSYEDSTLLGTDFVEAEYVPEPDPQPSTSQNLAGFSAVLVEAENYFLQQELLRNENELANLKERMSFDHIKNSESLVLLYTGLPNATVFESILELLRGVEFKKDILPPGVMLNLPPLLTTAQFTPQQVKQTECIARARIHVERAIRRMKVFKILQCISQTLRPYAQEVFQLVGALTNLQYPLIKEVEEYFISERE